MLTLLMFFANTMGYSAGSSILQNFVCSVLDSERIGTITQKLFKNEEIAEFKKVFCFSERLCSPI